MDVAEARKMVYEDCCCLVPLRGEFALEFGNFDVEITLRRTKTRELADLRAKIPAASGIA